MLSWDEVFFVDVPMLDWNPTSTSLGLTATAMTPQKALDSLAEWLILQLDRMGGRAPESASFCAPGEPLYVRPDLPLQVRPAQGFPSASSAATMPCSAVASPEIPPSPRFLGALLAPRTPFGQTCPYTQAQIQALTGFTGFAHGVLVVIDRAPEQIGQNLQQDDVSLARAGLFLLVDGRYRLQAQQQAQQTPPVTLVDAAQGLLGLVDRVPASSWILADPWSLTCSAGQAVHERGRRAGWTLQFALQTFPEVRLPADLAPTHLSQRQSAVLGPDLSQGGQVRKTSTPQNGAGRQRSWHWMPFGADFAVKARAVGARPGRPVLLCGPEDVAWLTRLRFWDSSLDATEHTPAPLAYALVFADAADPDSFSGQQAPLSGSHLPAAVTFRVQVLLQSSPGEGRAWPPDELIRECAVQGIGFSCLADFIQTGRPLDQVALRRTSQDALDGQPSLPSSGRGPNLGRPTAETDLRTSTKDPRSPASTRQGPDSLEIGYDPATTPYGLIGASQRWAPGGLPVAWVAERPLSSTPQRAIKTPQEVEASRQVHILEGAALVQLLWWLDCQALAGGHNEWDVVVYLEALRQQHPLYQGPSFATIAASGTSSAMIHYRPYPEGAGPIQPGLFLLDAGGQYLFGTTDLTRTVWVGLDQPSLRHTSRYTRVLQAHIHLANARFPQGTPACHLDTLARGWLWQDGLDYAHSTGHGVGAYLNVHESPSLSSQQKAPLHAGMIVSNEPGYYEAGWGGIRLENLVCVHPWQPLKDMDGAFMQDVLRGGGACSGQLSHPSRGGAPEPTPPGARSQEQLAKSFQGGLVEDIKGILGALAGVRASAAGDRAGGDTARGATAGAGSRQIFPRAGETELSQSREGSSLLALETLSLAPFDRRLIDCGQLTPQQRAWVDQYHGYVYETLASTLPDPARRWLQIQTAPLI